MNKIFANILIYLAGILWCLDLLPQIIKTIKTKRAKDLSIIFLLMSLIAFIAFIAGNAILKNWHVAIVHIPPVIANITMMILYFRYRRTEMSKATKLFQIQEDIKKTRVLTQYVSDGNDNKVIGDVTLIPKLNAGYYKIHRGMDGLHFVQDDLRTDELLRFKDSKMDETIKEVDKFWQLKKDFDNLGFVHNRGLLLYGPPGTGKSCLIKLLVEQMVKRGEVVFNAGCNINSLISGLKAFREVEPNRKLLVVLEDVDAIIRYDEHSLLELLDGDIQIDNVLYLGTTNYMHKIPERVKRPGRFDHLIEIDFPNDHGRRAYLENKLGKFETKQEIDRLVNATKGFSFGHLKEYLISVYCLKKNKNEVINRLKTKGYLALPDRPDYEYNKKDVIEKSIKEAYIGCKVKRVLEILNS